MSLVTSYLISVIRRTPKGEVHPGEIARLPRLIDQSFGDGDGILEFSDIADGAVEIASEMIDKVSGIISVLGDFF